MDHIRVFNKISHSVNLKEESMFAKFIFGLRSFFLSFFFYSHLFLALGEMSSFQYEKKQQVQQKLEI